jgi:GTPase SAR1 family protein
LLPAQLRVVLLGLDRSGKSSWVHALRPVAGRGPAPPPTAQPAVERVVVRTQSGGAFKLRCTDLPGGAEAAADVWPRHFAGAHAVVFVLDAADALRVQEAQDALDRCGPPAQPLPTHYAPVP